MLISERMAVSFEDAFRRLSLLPYVVAFDSAKTGPTGQWSFLAADPVAVIDGPTCAGGCVGWADDLRAWHAVVSGDSVIPFAGGLAGLFSYDFGHAFESLKRPLVDEFQLPLFTIGVYDWCLAWDHMANRCFLVSTGLTKDRTVDAGYAKDRLEWADALLCERTSPSAGRDRLASSSGVVEIASESFDVPAFPGVTSNFSPAGFEDAVNRLRGHIAAGDVFQANLAQRLLVPQIERSAELYLRLRRVNPAPLAGYFDAGSYQIVSASPERFLEVTPEGHVETRPIKGTRRRKVGIEADLYTRDELRESDKDVAENVMIVDLLRNDLSRVCDPATLHVPQLCEIETYETVQHLVSSVRAKLQPGCDVWDLIAGTFPGGSITGCPKIRAMDIITDLEGVARGPYCGSMFYHSFNGRFDSSILIRTLIASGGWIQMPVGGGITYASDPAAEYQETIDKAVGLVNALRRT